MVGVGLFRRRLFVALEGPGTAADGRDVPTVVDLQVDPTAPASP